MPGYLLDTNVISEVRRFRADAGVLAFLAATESDLLFISVLTLGELRKGVAIKRLADPKDADKIINAWVEGIAANFADRVLPVDAAVAHVWGDLSAVRTVPVIDALLAATALVHGLTLVTRNIRDFQFTNLAVLNPWKN
jgi:predicted nucleic acid-binding protein